RTPIRSIHHIDLKQSMQNGGGPACLRLRVVLTDAEKSAAHSTLFFTNALHEKIKSWIESHYRPSLQATDLADPQLLRESRDALDDLTRILSLGSIYDFQR